jgi:hypothetical protein
MVIRAPAPDEAEHDGHEDHDSDDDEKVSHEAIIARPAANAR